MRHSPQWADRVTCNCHLSAVLGPNRGHRAAPNVQSGPSIQRRPSGCMGSDPRNLSSPLAKSSQRGPEKCLRRRFSGPESWACWRLAGGLLGVLPAGGLAPVRGCRGSCRGSDPRKWYGLARCCRAECNSALQGEAWLARCRRAECNSALQGEAWVPQRASACCCPCRAGKGTASLGASSCTRRYGPRSLPPAMHSTLPGSRVAAARSATPRSREKRGSRVAAARSATPRSRERRGCNTRVGMLLSMPCRQRHRVPRSVELHSTLRASFIAARDALDATDGRVA
jgi:hypothetical protein